MQIYESTNNTNVLETSTSYNMSNKYKVVKTSTFRDKLLDNGFYLDGISAVKPRNKGRLGFQKHCMIFSRPDLVLDGDNKVQLLLTNAHDGSSSFRLNMGVYRAICANGLVVGNDLLESRIRHIGNNVIEELENEVNEFIRRIPLVAKTVKDMQSIELNNAQIRDFQEFAIEQRFKGKDNLFNVNFDTVGKVLRDGDKGNSLYNVFNRIQESTIKGGIKYSTVKDNNILDLTSRKVKGIDSSRKLNMALWNYAENMVA
jgi:hypothetical protein